ncbi:unnamed protein product, partial [Ectocarpus sp. 12 AP-2014]
MGLLNPSPNDSVRKEAGHTVPAIGWLKREPNCSSCSWLGHTTRLKSSPNPIFPLNDEPVPTGMSNTRCLSLGGQTTESSLTVVVLYCCSRKNSTNFHRSVAVCGMTSIGSTSVILSA